MRISAIILAGGKSTRMGRDKGLLLYEGKPMIQYVIDAVNPITTDIIIVSNQQGYEKFGYPIIEDEVKDCGPLAGIVAGLKNVQNEAALVLSCDVPFIKPELLQQLIDSEGDVVFAKHNDKIEPLVAKYGVHCTPILETALTNGTRKVLDAFDFVEVGYLDIPKEYVKFVKNMNSPEDLK